MRTAKEDRRGQKRAHSSQNIFQPALDESPEKHFFGDSRQRGKHEQLNYRESPEQTANRLIQGASDLRERLPHGPEAAHEYRQDWSRGANTPKHIFKVPFAIGKQGPIDERRNYQRQNQKR